MTVKILVKFDCNWADEADLKGFALFEPREYEYLCKEINAIEYPTEWWWGTNEMVMFESADDVFKCFDICILSSEEVAFLERHFVKFGDYGMTPIGSLQGNAPDSFYEENGYLDDYMKKG